MTRRLDQLVTRARAALLWETVWRGLWAPALVVGLFLCVSWTGLWLEVPHWARIGGVVLFGLLFCAALVRFARPAWPSRRAALDRIDRVSGVPHRPASVLQDSLANPDSDPSTRALWEVHRRRAASRLAALRAGLPSPRLVERDRFALRAGLLAVLIACAFVAGSEKYARLAAAFDWGTAQASGEGYRLDAWIDPPPYTGRPPIFLALDGKSDPAHPQRIEAPVGANVILRASSGTPSIEAGEGLATSDKPAGPAVADAENDLRRVLRADTRLIVRYGGSQRGTFDLVAIADRPPTIAFTAAPRSNVRGTLTLAYAVGDDYGVLGAQGRIALPMVDGKPPGRSLVEAPKIDLMLPAAPGGIGESETTADLSDHPWAGARVLLTLSARDEGGNEGRAEPVEITLPQKPFVKPLAKALVEQRRNLVMAPDNKGRVQAALGALMIAPDVFNTPASVYLGLSAVSARLNASRNDADLLSVADLLWEMAQRIENGDLNDAERELRAAQQQLREALQRGASDEEIRKLMENLRAAMDKFLNQLAEQQQRDRNNEQRADRGPNQSRTVTPQELQKMMEQMQEMARNGNMAEAQKMLDRLQNILENLKTARRRNNGNQRGREMAQALDELQRMTREQQDLRDETHRGRQQRGQRGQQQQGQNGMRQRGQNGQNGQQDEDEEDADNGEDGGQNGSQQGRMSQQELRQRQQALRNRLEQMQRKMKQMGRGQQGLDDAQGAMEEAENALGDGQSGKAEDAQGRALEAMRRGAQQMADAMQGPGGGDPSDQADDGDGEAPPGSPRQADSGADSDPLGRPMASDPTYNPRSRYDPMGVPAAQRAQRVLEELRRRLSDPSRPREEMDYLERLWRRF